MRWESLSLAILKPSLGNAQHSDDFETLFALGFDDVRGLSFVINASERRR